MDIFDQQRLQRAMDEVAHALQVAVLLATHLHEHLDFAIQDTTAVRQALTRAATALQQARAAGVQRGDESSGG